MGQQGFGGTPGVKSEPGEFTNRPAGGWLGTGSAAGQSGRRGSAGGGIWAKKLKRGR